MEPASTARVAITGIHHVTAFAGEAARHRRFYTDALGLDLVKRTVNFDAPTMWHLYYGLAGGAPGTLLTHFPGADGDGADAPPRTRLAGREIGLVTMSVAPGTLGAMRDRLASSGVATTTTTAFGREGLMLVDPDGMALRIEEHARRQQPDAAAEVARVALHVPDARETSAFLESVFGFRETAREDRVLRLALIEGDGEGDGEGGGDGGSGREIDVVHAPELRPAQNAAGSVHHVAWRVPDDAAQAAARRALLAAGVAVTEVRDRQYFRSIYFRIPGGVLFEIATDGPGFAVDEPAGSLGRALRLPPQYEPRRADIAARLPSLGDE